MGGFGELLRSFRMRAGLTQQEVAERSGVGLRTLRELEHGRVDRPRGRSMELVAAALGLSEADRARLSGATRAAVPGEGNPRLWVGVLGPLVVRQGAAAVDVGGSGVQCLLGLLAVQPGQVVSRDEIVEVLWEATPPAAYANLIQVYVRRLRRLLEPDSNRNTGFRVLVRTGGGYRLNLDAEELDLAAFEAFVARAGQAEADGRPEVAEQLLEQALAWWRGPVLGGAEPRLAQHPQVVAAAGRRVEAALAYAEAAQAVGAAQRVVGVLRAVASDEPLHEGVCARLMLALAAGGQQADALSVYEAMRCRLDRDLGIEPGEQLREAHLRVLRQQVHAGGVGVDDAGGVSADGGQDPPVWVPPAQLPAEVAGFTGRVADLAWLDRLVSEDAPSAVVISAIDGMAGVGKTALAVHWAHRVVQRFADGQLYVNLQGWAAGQPLRPIDALAGFLRAVGVAAEQVPVQTSEAAAMFRSRLAGRRVLVVLDNARDAEQVRPLLPGAAGSAVVVTSRDRLSGLVAREGASRLSLDVLAADEARALLVRLLGAERVAGEPAAVDDLARVCAYLPLALRIAAAQLLDQPQRGIGDYLGELCGVDRLGVLELAGDEQAAVRAAFDLSYAQLDGPARRLFRLLGLVPGPDIGVPTVAALAGDGTGQVRRLLDRLTAAHLLNQPTAGRYAFHDLLRLYAAQQATAEDSATDRQAALHRVYEHYLASAHAAAELFYPHILRLPAPEGPPGPARAGFADDVQALAWLETERPNLIAAITHTAEHGPREVAWRLADALRGYLTLRVHAVDWLTAARAAQGAANADGDPLAQAAAELNLGGYQWFQARYRQAIDHQVRTLELARKADWRAGQATAFINLGGLHGMLGELDQATAYLAEGVALARRTGNVASQAVGLTNLGLMWCERGDLDKAIDHHRQAMVLHRHGSRSARAAALDLLSVAYYLQGRLEQAQDHLARALALNREIGARSGEASTLAGLALTHAERGHFDQALDLVRTALAHARDTGHRSDEADTLITSATVHHRIGEHRQALEHHRQALRIARDTGYRYAQTEALVGLADALTALDEPHQALIPGQHGLTLARTSRYRLLEGRAHTTLATIHHRLGDHRKAADYARRALAVHAGTGHRLGTARTHLLLGHILHDSGHPDTADRHWHQALNLFTEIGTPEADEVRALLASARTISPAPPG